MKLRFVSVVFLLSFFNLSAQVELESLAKSEIARYIALKNYSVKRASGENIDIIYAALNLSPDMKTAFLKGDVNYHFKTSGIISELNFDLRTELTVDSAVFRGQSMIFTHGSNDILNIRLHQNVAANTIDSIRIYYHGMPDQSNRAYERNVTVSGPIIATLSEPYGAHYWWPCRENLSDKIDSIDIRITVDTAYKVASNGVLKSITRFDDTFHTYHWQHRYPIATYLVAFASSRYAVYSDYALLKNGKPLEILNYVYPHKETEARTNTKATIPVIQLYDSLFGTYPFYKEKYGHAQFPVGGGMEHQTMSFMGNFGYDLIAHELAHQWFGDKITCGSWQDLWLNESFATYCNLLCYDFLKSETEWLNQLKKFKTDVMSQPGGSVMAKDTVNQNALFDYRTTYQKGAMVLNQMRWLIGDKSFFDGVRNYMASSKLTYQFARSNDLQYYLEQSSGMNLTDYFNDWIIGEGYPIYNIKWQQRGTEISIDVIQSQSHPSVELYNVPLPLLLRGYAVDTIIRMPINKGIENFKINLPYTIKEIIFDPEEWILGKSSIQFEIGQSNKNYHLYPNPTHDLLTVSLDDLDIKGWKLTDAAGRNVLSKSYSSPLLKGNIFTIDLNFLADGVYTIQLESKDGTYTEKLILD